MKGKRVTGFTNGEEEAVHLTKVVPFLVEDELRASEASTKRRRIGCLRAHRRPTRYPPEPGLVPAGAEALLKLLA